MQSTIPIWVALAVAALTGTFTLAAQGLSAYITRKSQRQLFLAQENSRIREKLAERIEEYFALVSHYLDIVHTSVVAYRLLREGGMPVEEVTKAINAAGDNDKYQRMMLLQNLYLSDTRAEFSSWNEAMLRCQNMLLDWAGDTSKEILDDLNEAFEQVLNCHNKLKKILTAKLT